MKTKYDNYNPAIPETEDVPDYDTLPPPADSAKQEEKHTQELPKAPERKERPVNVKEKRPPKPKPKKEKIKKKKEEPTEPLLDIAIVSVKKFIESQTFRWLLGLFMGFMAVYLAVSFLSYFTACVKDQSEVNNTPIGYSISIANKAGEGGARISEFLINECFGLGSLVIVGWLFAMAMKQLVGRPKFKSVDFTIKSLVALITVSLIIGLLTISLQSPVNWGGYHGRYVNEFIIHFFGYTGAIILCLFMVSCFVVICLRDLINWIIKLKHKYDEKKRIEAEKRALREQREQEIEDMRRYEQAEDAKGNESVTTESESELESESAPLVEEDAHMVFDTVETGLYSSLPDFEDVVEKHDKKTQASAHRDKEAVAPNTASSVAKEQPQPAAPSSKSDASSTPSPAITPKATEQPEEKVATEEEMKVNVNSISQIEPSRTADTELMPGAHPYTFPPVDILREGVVKVSVDAQEQLENKDKIRKTLLDFGIPITSIEATVGPTVTLYEIVPDKGVRIAKIRSLVDDIALSLSAEGVRIIAPIPGKGTVGIEVANKDPQTVSMRTIIKSRTYQESKYKLPIAMGSTISNDVYIADLAKMPHLLVAGATGQGKSVGLNAIIASLLYRKRPDELKFVMIDPKMVEFSLYAKIEKHYLAKIPGAEDAIITDMDKVVATLNSLCVEMDNRYQLLKDAHTRNLVEYNDKIKDRKLNPLDGHRFLPYIVVVVDEFSDLIMTAGKEVEIPIARLAQKARAVGMHVIIATQRPSTNVITGIIKANFPARMAFKVSSGVDSKTILDTTGAQQLIGRGDMLISNSSPMVRVQCAFIDTPEVEEICDYIERQPYGQGAYELPEPVVAGSDSDSEMGNNFGDRDPLFEEIARLIVTSNTASTSSLQRRYSIGYNRAGKIMDQLEAAGIVGPAHGGKPRSVLVDAITLESILNP